MSTRALTYTLVHRRGSRAFFLARSTQHVESVRLLREIARAALALAAVVGWGAVALLLAG
jgi:hypothetical protein